MFCFRIVRIIINLVLASLASNCISTILYMFSFAFWDIIELQHPIFGFKGSFIEHYQICWIPQLDSLNMEKNACKVFQECFLTKKTKRIFYNLSFWIENSGIVRSGENSKTPTKIFSNTFIYPPLSCFSFLLQLWNEKKVVWNENFFLSLPVWNNRGSVFWKVWSKPM